MRMQILEKRQEAASADLIFGDYDTPLRYAWWYCL